MPLLGQKIYLAKSPGNLTKKGKGTFEIPFTNEVFSSKDDYDKQMQCYKQPIWTCQCTGFTGLSYEEALTSEMEVHKRLSAKFPKSLEKMVLELVHHRAVPLDVIVDEAQQCIQSVFEVGEQVELKVKIRGKVIRGKIVNMKNMADDEVPTSDKENSVSDDHPYSSPQSKHTKSSLFQYNIQLDGEDKVISSVPGKDLLHTTALPSRDLLQLFIRASAVQAGSKATSPWVVSDELVNKFELSSQINEIMLSPYKVNPSSLVKITSVKRPAESQDIGSKATKKRKLSEHHSGSSKLKQSTLTDFNKKDNMVLSIVLQQNASNVELNNQVTPTKHILASPEKVQLDHSYSSPPPHLKASQSSVTKTKPKSSPSPPKKEKVVKKEKKETKVAKAKKEKKEKKAPASKKLKASDAAKKAIAKSTKSKAATKKLSKKKVETHDSESEDVEIIDEVVSDDDVIIMYSSPVGSTRKEHNEKKRSEVVKEKSPKKKLPTKRKLTDHFTALSSPKRSPRKSASPTKSVKKSPSKSPVKAKKAKTTPVKVEKEDEDETSSEDEDDTEIEDEQKSQEADKKQTKKTKKAALQKKNLKEAVSKKKATKTTKKGSSQKSTPQKASSKTADKSTPKKATPKKSTPKKETPRKESPTKKVTPKKSTPKKTPKKSTPKKTPKKSTPGKKTPKKSTPGGKSSAKKGKPFKQATLFDVGAKKGAKSEGNLVTKATPKSKTPRTPAIANKLFRVKTKDVDLYRKLLSKAAKELTEKQVNNLRAEIKQDVLIKFKQRMDKLKWQNMTPEERERAMQLKKEERKKQQEELRIKQKKIRDEERAKKAEELRLLKIQQAVRYEDQELKLKALPAPKLVTMPDGIPNTLFGDIAMVVEFLNCYSGLLMPDDPYPVTADTLMKALVCHKEGFAYLARVLVILLKTLLQDEISADYREISVKLSDITVNMHTCSELLRMSLRRTDHDHEGSDSSDDSEEEEEEDVPYNLVEKLETCEYFELEPEEKLEVLVCVCHRMMGSYAIQDFMEEKQKDAVTLWKKKMATLKEKNDRVREEKRKKREQQELERQEKEKLLEQQKEAGGEDKDGEGKDAAAPVKKPPPKKKSKKSDKAASQTNGVPPVDNEEAMDMASVVKRRRLLAAQVKAEKAEEDRLKRERRLKEIEESNKLRDAEMFQKSFEDGIQLAKLTLRQCPVGTDRNHSRYWIFSTVVPGLFIEKGWADKDVAYTPPGDLDDESNEQHIEHTIPKVGQNLWFQYSSVKEIDALLEALDNQGIRESALFVELKKRYDDITRKTFLSRRSGPDLRDSDGPEELLASYREDLSDLELNVRQGQLGGVNNYEKWEKKLMAATKLKDLGTLMIETQDGINPKFLQGILAPRKPKATNNGDEEVDKKEASDEPDEPEKTDKLLAWIEAVQTAPTLSRLHVLLAICETSVKWEKSAANAKCRICRKKKDDNKLLLCDECNQPFHMFCLRPALTSVPKGEWKCPACAPSVPRVSRTRVYYGSDSDQAMSSADDSDIEHEETCVVCDEDGELVQCCHCPSVYHRDCHEPPLKNFPRGRWKCAECVDPSKKAKRARQKRAAERRKENESRTRKTTKQTRSKKQPANTKATRAVRKRKVLSESEEESSSEEETSSSSSSEEEDDDSASDYETKPKPKPTRRAPKQTKKQPAKPKKKAKPKKVVVFDNEIAEGIISKLMCYRGSVPFRTSPDKVEAPDYDEIIKIPMDLHMLKNKCTSEEYNSYEEYFADVKLIFTNAHDYYEESNYIRKQASKLEDYFVNQVKWAVPDAVSIWEEVTSTSATTQQNEEGDEDESDQKTTTTRRSRRR